MVQDIIGGEVKQKVLELAPDEHLRLIYIWILIKIL